MKIVVAKSGKSIRIQSGRLSVHRALWKDMVLSTVLYFLGKGLSLMTKCDPAQPMNPISVVVRKYDTASKKYVYTQVEKACVAERIMISIEAGPAVQAMNAALDVAIMDMIKGGNNGPHKELFDALADDISQLIAEQTDTETGHAADAVDAPPQSKKSKAV